MSLYEKLSVDKTANQDEIKKAYHKLSKVLHPDKGGDPEKFKEIQHAYEVLSDDEKRQMYDMTGSENPEQGGNPFGGGMHFGGGMPFGGMPFGDLGSMFGGMFGNMGGGGPQRRRKAPRGPDKTQDLPLSLKDFYHGREIQMKFHQQRECNLCSATGCLKSETCSACRGQGAKMMVRQIGPGMIQQSMVTCNDCNGEGKRVLQSCHECNGKKYKTQEKVLTAKIEPGMTDNQKLRFEGECSDSPDYEKPGDVILTLMRTNVGEDSDFEWQGNDLHISHSIELAEAFLGFNASINGHPSGKPITLTWGGGPLMHDAVLIVKGLGMPFKNKKGEFGDLYVHIDISISSAEKREGWTAEQRKALHTLFPDWVKPETNGIPLSFQL
jgi:DnaJ family protein A protein 2